MQNNSDLTVSDKDYIDKNVSTNDGNPEPLPWEAEQEMQSDPFESLEVEKGGERNMPQVIDDYGSYDIPKGDSSYLKLSEPETRIRLCSKPLEVKLHENKSGVKFSTSLCQGEGCELCATGIKIKYKYAYIVLSRKDNKAYVYEAPITVFRQIASYARNEEYGDPEEYDITIKKEGEKPQIVYTVMPSPKKTKLTDAELEILGKSGLSLQEAYANKAKV